MTKCNVIKVLSTLSERLKHLRRTDWLVIGSFVIVLAFTLLFAVRTYRRAQFWGQHRDQPIAGWMRVGFVANSYEVPPSVLQRAIGLPPDTPDRRPLDKIAEDQGRPFDEVKADLERAIADFRTHRPRPGDVR